MITVNLNEEEIVKGLNIDHMRQNIRTQIESKLTSMVEEQIRTQIYDKVQAVLDSSTFTAKVESLLLNIMDESPKVTFTRKAK